jgi:predicted DNA-binding protein
VRHGGVAYRFRLKKGRKTTDSKSSAGSAPRATVIELDPRVIQRALNQAVKTLTDPEYQQQMTKLTQSSIANSIQTFQRLSTLSTRLSKMDSETMSSIVEGSIDDLTRAFLQFNSDQMVLLQRLSARTLEILDSQARQK